MYNKNKATIFRDEWGYMKDGWIWFFILLPITLIIIGVILFSTHFAWNTGEDIYTGYIYSTEDYFNRTEVHIRFSDMAGADEQPSFCVAEEDRQLVKELAGSGKKVRVVEPAGIAWKFFTECQIPASVEVVNE